MEKFSKTSMMPMNAWDTTHMWDDIPRSERPRYSPVLEFRRVKHNAEDAIAELLEILPKDDVRCGMAKVLAEWLLGEVELLPDHLLVADDNDEED